MSTGGPSPPRQLPQEATPMLQEGIFLVLSRWSALQMAIESEWGGRGSRQLADQLFSDIVSWFTQPSRKEPLYIDDLEDILEQGMLSLNTIPDDGSIEEVAEKLMIIHEECLDGDYSSIVKLREAGPITGAHQHFREVVDDDNNEDDNNDENSADEMDDSVSNKSMDSPEIQAKSNPVNARVNEPKPRKVQDDDGWQVVSSRRNKGKRT